MTNTGTEDKEFMLTEEFVSVREITIIAPDLEAAKASYERGDWDDETEVDFYSNSIVHDPHGLSN